MNIFISSEQDFEDYRDKFSDDLVMIHFKMIGIGSNTLSKAEHNGSKICEIARKQPGFFLVSQDGSSLRESMHDLVDLFCDKQEGQK